MLSILQDLDLVFEAEQFAHADTIEAINAEAFGPAGSRARRSGCARRARTIALFRGSP